jgi:UDP-N-acetylmuramate--alanine ligase
MNIKEAKNIYFVGIGGIGVSAIARLCLGMGKIVAGSDLRDSQTIRDLVSLGAQISIGHSIENIRTVPDAVVYSEDISSESAGFAELEFLESKGVPKISYSQALGQMMEGHFGIGVSGTNGKSTTTALLGLMLEQAGLDPTVVIGSKLSDKNSSDKFQVNARLGSGQHFVAEADEYHRHMLDAHPSMIVLTNIAEDHLDYYKDLNEIKSAFGSYVRRLKRENTLVFNADDSHTVEVSQTASCHKFTFGIDHYADLQAINLKTEAGRQTFDLHLNNEKIGLFELFVPGKFNVLNALGASLAAIKLGVKPEIIKQVLASYAGLWRRFEKVGEFQGKPVISDYAHHPAGVEATIQAAKEFYPGKKILTVFQPHHRNRTKKLFSEFVESLVRADRVILPEIFDVAGREHGEDVSSKQLVEELVKLNVQAEFSPDLEKTSELIMQQAKDFDVILCMGAGDIDLMARKLING